MIRWSSCVTTVPARRQDLLPKTLESLALGGFDKPWLFVDGADPSLHAWYATNFADRASGVTARNPRVMAFGNWALALAEMLIRFPVCDRYAVFQDDLLCMKNLRHYLDRCSMPEKGYWNLITFASNQRIAPAKGGWFEAGPVSGNDPRRLQTGRGAVGLVFSREGAFTLIGSSRFHRRPMEVEGIRHKKIDGCIVNAMNGEGWREWVHSPSPLGHTGGLSTMGNAPHPAAGVSFPGERFDALSFLAGG